ncbi:MAG TPA: efflux RND transporter permease subunit [Candidatus Eisenbacteria bacterium]|nr:efflux RND transporter permease subunit [Candidatus Eisenbacteria bacterium]
MSLIGRIIEFSATHRTLIFVATAFLVVASFLAIRNIPLDAIPDLSDPQVIVFTEWMGRSPDLVEDQITYPIVSSLLGAPRVEAVRGQSMFGMSFIYVIFKEGTDLYWARSRVLEYMASIRERLPEGVNPVLGPDASSVGWIFQYALVDRTGRHDLAELRTFQDFNLRYALGSVPGVAEVASVGGYQRQYQVEVNPDRLHAYDLSLSDVTAAIRRSNSDVGGRVIEMAGREYFIRGRGYIRSLDDLRSISLGANPRTGTPIRVADVGTVSFGPDIRRGVSELDGEGEAVGGTIVMRYGENALKVIERVKEKVRELQPSFPPGVELVVAYDRSDLIHHAIETLNHTLIEEGIVVSLVILVFLLHLRSTLVPVLTLPVAVGLAFVPMYFLGINSNIMSLGGIAIAIGAMVDAAIVLVENAHKHLETAPPGADRRRVLIEAAQEVGPPIFFSLLIITVAFLPIFGLNGQAGRLFKPLAFTKTFAMALAALVSITLAPALMTLFIRGKIRHEKDHPVSRAMIAVYKPFAWVALKNPKTTIAIGLAAVLSAAPMAMNLGHEFMPPLNEGDILYMPTTFPNISIEEAKRHLQVQDRLIRRFPEVERVFGKAGRMETPTDPAPLSMVETIVKLKPRSEWRKIAVERWYSGWAPGWLKPLFRPIWPDRRRITWQELTEELNRAVQIPGWTNAWTMPIKTRIDMLSTGIRTPIGVKIFGADLDSIERIGVDLERALSRVPDTRSVYSDRNTGGFYLDIVPSREALARYGLTMGDVQDVIEAAVGGQPIAMTVEGRNRFSINVRYSRELRQDLERLRHVLVPLPRGGRSGSGSGSGSGMSTMGAAPAPAPAPGEREPLLLASAFVSDMPLLQAQSDMGGMGGGTGGQGSSGMNQGSAGGGMSGASGTGNALPPGRGDAAGLDPLGGMGGAHIPLGTIADIKVVTGPPMIRDEAGMLVGYVYVDMDVAKRDIGGYVDDAKKAVAHEVRLPAGYSLKWTGQYELLESMQERMRFLVPLTLVIIVLLLYMNFGSVAQTLIVLCSVPFALVGSVWLLAFLGYNLSTAVWVGIIALVGLAAQTGVVMIVYCDSAYLRRKREGRIRDLDDIVEATLEGSVQRVRPKLMTVATMMIGLVPLLWSQGAGADVMKRVAAPMVGGLFTSAFLTLEIIPVVYAYWRYAQLKREQRVAGERSAP